MSNSQSSSSPADEPLSPEALAVMARARRSFAISIGLLVVGLITVALAVVYRSGSASDVGKGYEAGVLAVPVGAEIVSAVPGDGMISITYQLDGETKLRLVNGMTGALIRDIPFASE